MLTEEIYLQVTTLLNYEFKNRSLLERALTHSSAIQPGSRTLDNQAFAVLGDGLLRAIIEDILLELIQHPTKGKLSFERDALVNNQYLAKIAKKLKLDSFIQKCNIRRKKKGQNLTQSDKILTNCLEAILAAIFLDSERDYLIAKKFVIMHWNFLFVYHYWFADEILQLTRSVSDQDLCLDHVKYLLSCGADVNISLVQQIGDFDSYLSVSCDPHNIPDFDVVGPGLMPSPIAGEILGVVQDALSRAIAVKNLSLVTLLVQNGAHLDRRTLFNMSPLYKAACSGHVEITRLLLENKAPFITSTSDGYTPLHIAIQNQHKAIVELFALYGIPLEDRSFNGWTGLHLAAEFGYAEIVEILLKNGCTVDSKIIPNSSELAFELSSTALGKTPLHLAAREGHINVVQILLSHHADSTIADAEGNKPIDLTDNLSIRALLTPTAPLPTPSDSESSVSLGNNKSTLYGDAQSNAQNTEAPRAKWCLIS